MNYLFSALLATGLLLGSARAGILLNEIQLDVSGPDGNFEFIELRSTNNTVESCAGHSIIIIDNDRTDPTDIQEVGGPDVVIGRVREVLNLDELSTGSNGLLLLGNGYTGVPRGGPWSGSIDAATTVGDPSGLGDGDIGPNDGVTILLVQGSTVTKDQDLDVNNDGVLDWLNNPIPTAAVVRTVPWTGFVDGISTRETDDASRQTPYSPNGTSSDMDLLSINRAWNVLGSTRNAENISRAGNNNTPANAANWYGGKMANTSPSPITVTFRADRTFGPSGLNVSVQATPGRPNLTTNLPATSFRINEVGLNPSGNNDRFQYVEIINSDGQARSLAGHWLLLIDNLVSTATMDPFAKVGTIMRKWDLSGMATGSNGLLLLGDDFSRSYTPFEDLVSPATSIGDPIARTAASNEPTVINSTGWGVGDLGNKDAFTLILVKDPTVALNAALDIDTTDTGVIDATSVGTLGTIQDQVGFSQIGRTTDGRTYATQCDLRSVMAAENIPDNLSRKPGNFAISPSAWYGGSYGAAGGSSLGFDIEKKAALVGASFDRWFGGYRGAGTPGLLNLASTPTQATSPAPSPIVINEVMIDPTDRPTGGDANGEYIELRSTNDSIAYLDDLWLVVVNTSNNSGTIEASTPLSGFTTGPNGLIIVGDNYDSPDSTPYGATDYPAPPDTAAFDPSVSFSGNNLPNNGTAVLLIRAPLPAFISADGLTITGDLDPENDGSLLLPTAYCAELVDSIVTSARSPGPAYAHVVTTPFEVHHLTRSLTNPLTNSILPWSYGQLDQTPNAIPSLTYTDTFAGPFKSGASPGRPNLTAPLESTARGQLLINEVLVNPSGRDSNYECIELRDAGGRERSLNGYYLLMLDNVLTNTGSVRAAWSLDGMKTGTNGLFLLGSRYPTENPWAATMDPATATGDPAGRDGLTTSFDDEVLGRETDNQSLTLILVRGYSRYVGFDVDDKKGTADSPGDGILEGNAWLGGLGGIHDAVMFRSYTGASLPAALPSDPWNGYDYALADLSTTFLSNFPTFYHPETYARFRDNTTPNSAAAWYGADLDPTGTTTPGLTTRYLLTDTTHPPFPTLAGFTGTLTPGRANLPRQAISGTTDTDGDGFLDIVEIALGTSPTIPTPNPIRPGTTTGTGPIFGTINFPRLTGGSLIGGVYETPAYQYVIDSSPDLVTWTPTTTTTFVGATSTTSTTVENATYRLNFPVTTPAGRHFLRLRIIRR